MARPEKAIDPHGPLADFASGLRALRQHAGLTYKELVEAVGFCPSVLSGAASGETLPTWRVTKAYVTGCKGSVEEWLPRWEEARKRWPA